MPVKNLKEIILHTFLKNKVGQSLSDEEIILLYNNFGFINEVYYLSPDSLRDTSGYIIDTGKLSTWDVKYEFYLNGKIKSETWYKNGKYHRENGPAYQLWYKNGQLWTEVWLKDGKVHRDDGPAYQIWHEDGQLKKELWYINGENIKQNSFITKSYKPEFNLQS